MIFQRSSYDCGPCAIANACLALGRDHETDDIASRAGTTQRSGTNEKGIISALHSLGYETTELSTPGDVKKLWSYVTTSISRGQSIILCVDGVDHWIALVGMIGNRIVAFDSQRTAENFDSNGVWIYDERSFRDRLGGSRYAISISDSAGALIANSLGLSSNVEHDNTVQRDLMSPAMIDHILGGR